LGLKYFAGAVEDHFGKAYVGIEGYLQGGFAQTFTKSELEILLKQCWFDDLFFYYPFPDYKFPEMIYSDDYLPGREGDFPKAIDYIMQRTFTFSEDLAFKSLAGTEEFKIFANSFLIEAVKL
jgi:hypothetical protein